MLHQLRQIAVFAKVVDHGSFRSAAKALSLSPSVVSHHVAELEKQLGKALLYRSTRKLTLTSDGERLLTSAQAMLSAAEQAIADITDYSDEPSGELKLTVPAVHAQSDLIDKITAFNQTYPKIHLTIDFSDLRREVIGEGIDLAIRVGWLKDSSLKARKLDEVERWLVAAPVFLESRKMPSTPNDMADWPWIEFSPAPKKPEFEKAGEEPQKLTFEPSISVNDAHALYSLCKAGAGLAILPQYLVEKGIESGELLRLLPDWTTYSVGVWAVWPPNAPKNGLTKRLVDFLASH